MGYPSSLLRLWFNMSTSKKGPIFKGHFDLPTSNHQFARGIFVFSGAFGKHLLYRDWKKLNRNGRSSCKDLARNTSRKSKTHYRTPQEKHTPCFSWRCLVFCHLTHIWVICWQIFIVFHPSTTTLTKHAQVASRFRKHWELVALDRSGEARRYRIACTKCSVVTCYNSRCGLFERKPGRNRWLKNFDLVAPQSLQLTSALITWVCLQWLKQCLSGTMVTSGQALTKSVRMHLGIVLIVRWKGSLKLAMEGSDVQSAAQETVAIKFEDNQAKGQPNQLKTEYDPVGGWVRGGWKRGRRVCGIGKVPILIPFDRRNRVGAHIFPAHELGRTFLFQNCSLTFIGGFVVSIRGSMCHFFSQVVMAVSEFSRIRDI